jgi:hypothetical protein
MQFMAPKRKKTKTKVVRQEVLWMTWEEIPSLPSKGKFKPVPLAGLKEPNRVWTLYHETDFSKTPLLPINPVHNHNAFLEDWMHDWNVHGDKFFYFTRIMGRGVWVLFEYTEEVDA